MMRKLLILSLTILMTACQGENSTTAKAPPVVTGSEYFAEYGIPSQSLIQACSGYKELVRPVSKCTKRSNNAIVNAALCYTLPPVFMSIPSPAGQKQSIINGGYRLETCAEGSTVVEATSLICNSGFRDLVTFCQSYATAGSYVVQKDQIYRHQDNLKLFYTMGHDHSAKKQGNLKLILLME